MRDFPYKALLKNTEYTRFKSVDDVPCYRCRRFAPYRVALRWHPCIIRTAFCWKYGKGMCPKYLEAGATLEEAQQWREKVNAVRMGVYHLRR